MNMTFLREGKSTHRPLCEEDSDQILDMLIVECLSRWRVKLDTYYTHQRATNSHSRTKGQVTVINIVCDIGPSFHISSFV